MGSREISWRRAGRIPDRIAREARHARLRAFHDVRLGKGSIVQRGAVLYARGNEGSIRIGARARIRHGAMLLPYGGFVHLGDDCSVNPYTILYGHGGLSIGNSVRIAAHTVMIPANHGFDDMAVPIREQELTKRGISIGDNVWVGSNVVVLDGCRIGTGSVIAAGAVVSGDVPPGVVVGGVPARVLRARGATMSTDASR